MLTWGSRGDKAGDQIARRVSTRRRRERIDSTSIVSNSRATTAQRRSAASGLWSADRIRNTSLASPPTTIDQPPLLLTLLGRPVHTLLPVCCPSHQRRQWRSDVEVGKLLNASWNRRISSYCSPSAARNIAQTNTLNFNCFRNLVGKSIYNDVATVFDYVTFGSLLSQIRLSSVWLSSLVCL